MRKVLLGFVVLLGLVISGPLLLAQQETGSIAGSVVDPSQGAVPNADVTIRNDATNVSFKAKTDSSGLYIAPQLGPGMYTITVQVTGFATAERPGIQVRVNDRLRVDFTLQIGSVTQTVEVTGAAPQLQTEDATTGQVVDNQRTVDLPLNGRNWLQLATLAPATVPYPQTSGQIPQSLEMNLGGTTAGQQDYLIDGSDMTYFIGSDWGGDPLYPRRLTPSRNSRLKPTVTQPTVGGLGARCLIPRSKAEPMRSTAPRTISCATTC